MIGFLVLVIVVGDGLIFLIYGKVAALTGLICILGGLLPVGLIALVLFLMDVIVRKENET